MIQRRKWLTILWSFEIICVFIYYLCFWDSNTVYLTPPKTPKVKKINLTHVCKPINKSNPFMGYTINKSNPLPSYKFHGGRKIWCLEPSPLAPMVDGLMVAIPALGASLFPHSPTYMSRISSAPRKKWPYFPLYWLFNKDDNPHINR